MQQVELQFSKPTGPVTDRDKAALRDYLDTRGWSTRKEVAIALGWSERKVPDVAETLGAEIVRGQRGFNLVKKIGRDDLPAALQAADAFLSQGKKMIRYAMALRRKLHERIG
jgi:hypothetical protein